MIEVIKMDAKHRIRQIRRVLRERELIYIGPRGADALPLASLGTLGAIFSLIAPGLSGVSVTCLEEISGVRVDLNNYSLDEDHSEAASRFREALFGKLSRPCAVVPYSPSRALSRGWLMARDTVLPLGLFYEQQSCFDHKPWVESELKRWGIATIPWTYVHTLSSPIVTDFLIQEKPFVVRWPRSRGGSGIWLVQDRKDLVKVAEPPLGDSFFCVAPYFEAALSVNVNACVFPGGEVSIHGSSVQLVGIEVCTPRPLGYAGNDFASMAELPKGAIQDLDAMARALGNWLARRGYLGAFGFDALVVDDHVLFVELNPRFQASSAIATRLDHSLGRPDQYLEHIAVFLGLEVADRLSLSDLVREQEGLAQIMIYNGRSTPVALKREPEIDGREIFLLPTPAVVVEPHGTLAAILWNGGVTNTGRELQEDARAAVLHFLKCFAPEERQ